MAIAITAQFDPGSTGSPIIGLGYSSTANKLFVYGNFSSTVEKYSETGTFDSSIPNTGNTANDYDIDVLSQSGSLAGVAIPAGTVLLINGESGGAIIRAVDPGTGAVLATLNTAVGSGSVVGGTYHQQRGTLFLINYSNDVVSEVNAATGAVINSFSVGALGYDVFYGDIDVDPQSGDLFLVSSSENEIIRVSPTGSLLQTLALPAGVGSLSGLAFDDDAPGVAYVSSTGGVISKLSGLSSGGVTINGTSGADVISPTKTVAGQPLPTNLGDFIFGLAGNDQLDGGLGGDRLEGGAGSDIYTVESSGDDVVETDATKAGGIDTVKSSIDYTLDTNVEKLILTGNADLDGTGNSLNNTLTGNGGANNLYGLGGKDILDGKGGADYMEGGGDSDTYTVDNVGDITKEFANGGTADLVKASITHALQAEVENLTLIGTAPINGTGNGGNNKIIGNKAANTLDGGIGNDTLLGGVGNDILIGGDGNDLLTGGDGLDTLTGGIGNDKFIFVKPTETTLANPDVITDFAQGLDKIDLSKIDANILGSAAGNQAFTFVGNNQFGGTGASSAGQLRYEQDGNETRIYGDLNGDGIADFMIKLDDPMILQATDFIL